MDDNEDQLSGREFSPPYFTIGLYDRERRVAIEQPNRQTIERVFTQRQRERIEHERRQRAYANHLQGIHSFGYCEWCGPRYFYD